MGDTLTWVGGITGTWGDATNWYDTTLHANPSSVPPGSNDFVTVLGASNVVRVVAGTGASSNLSITGPVTLAGQFTTGTLSATGPLTIASGDSLGIEPAAAICRARPDLPETVRCPGLVLARATGMR